MGGGHDVSALNASLDCSSMDSSMQLGHQKNFCWERGIEGANVVLEGGQNFFKNGLFLAQNSKCPMPPPPLMPPLALCKMCYGYRHAWEIPHLASFLSQNGSWISGIQVFPTIQVTLIVRSGA